MTNVPPPPILDVRDLTVAYPHASLPAVEGASFQIAAGECLGLVGESGSGKSTLGRAIARLLPPGTQVEGCVRIEGTDLLALPERQLRRWRGAKLALIFQDPMTRLDPLLTIEEHGLEVLRSHLRHVSRRAARQQVRDTLAAVRIDPARARQYPHEFSGGMRQRVAIALALLLDPVLLIADEPTTSLDATVAAEILGELTALRRDRHLSVLLITHDLGLVATSCDRVAVMYDGAIVEMGEAATVLRSPQHPYTRSLLGAALHLRHRECPPVSPVSPPLLEVRDLVKHFRVGGNPIARRFDPDLGRIKAVDGVSLEVWPGEIVGLLGESGSGKSTVARLILQLLRPDAGSVRFDGIELTALRGERLRRLRSQIQMMFQDPRACLNPRMTVLEAIADPLRLHGAARTLAEARSPVLEMLDRVGLPASFAARLPRDLSGGQLQRVALARALILHPRFLICDEPTSMLDAAIQGQILDLMLDLKRAFDLTYLLVVHDLAIARFLCDRVAVMHRGKIVETGDTARVFASPQHPYTQQLLASLPIPPVLG